MPPMETPPRVFLSYSHDGKEHEQRVLALAARLRDEGIDAWIDRYSAGPEEGWPRWVADQLRRADFVVSVCTMSYRRSFEGHNLPGAGLGVNQEGYLITQDLYETGHKTKKYVAAAFGSPYSDVPGELRGQPFFRLPQDYEALYRYVSDQPAVAPPALGQRRQLPPLPAQSLGNRHQSDITEFLTPEREELSRLAPSNGVFLSRLINPIKRESGDNVTTVWMASRGPLQYWIDSVRIRDYPQLGLGGNPVVTVPLDAEYRFTFEEGSDVVHALNPALSIGPETRLRVAFSIAMTMDRFYHVGVVLLWVQYHTSDGRSGAVALVETPAGATHLAKLAGGDVRYALSCVHDVPQIVITPEGLQRGIEQEHLPPYCYVPITIGEWWSGDWGRDRLLRLRSEWQRALSDRTALTARLAEPQVRQQLAEWLDAAPDAVAADLSGGLADPAATTELLHLLDKSALEQVAFHGLAVRHLVLGDDLLCQLLIERQGWLAEGPFSDGAGRFTSLAVVLAARPSSRWVDVLALLFQKLPEAGGAFFAATRSDLDADDLAHLERLLGAPPATTLYVRSSVNGWTALQPLAYEGNGKYRRTLFLPDGSHQFKIAAADWADDTYGADRDDVWVTADTTIALARGDGTRNLWIAGTRGGCRYTFHVTVKGTEATLRVETEPSAFSAEPSSSGSN
jgi:hypothetical protein